MQVLRQLSRTFSIKTWRRLGIVLGLYVVPVVLFVQLADEVLSRDTLAFDTAILEAINLLASPMMNTAAVILTQFGGFVGVGVLTVGLAALLWVRRQQVRAIFLVAAVVGAALLNTLLKLLLQRDRPELWERLVTENSYSFPSGHAMASSAFALALIVVFWRTRFRWLVIVGAIVYMVVIALSRLYLGVHYPTDIAAGWIVSGTWVAIVAAVTIRRHGSLHTT